MGEDINMDAERRNRYLDKIDRLEERLDDVEEWMGESEDLTERKKDMFAVFKAFQEAVQVVTDICAMYLSDATRGIGDDRENIDKAAGRLYPEELSGDLGEANGLRNRIVHDYNGFDARRAVASIRDVMEAMDAFGDEVKRWIERN